jgi:glycine/D-amino acid oxidase-like deaminating enzyme
MAFTPDYVPLADHAPGEPNTWYAGGFCGHGMPFGLIFGKLLAQAALGGDVHPLAPFRLGRLFGKV